MIHYSRYAELSSHSTLFLHYAGTGRQYSQLHCYVSTPCVSTPCTLPPNVLRYGIFYFLSEVTDSEEGRLHRQLCDGACVTFKRKPKTWGGGRTGALFTVIRGDLFVLRAPEIELETCDHDDCHKLPEAVVEC